jgi:hypothetical protein
VLPTGEDTMAYMYFLSCIFNMYILSSFIVIGTEPKYRLVPLSSNIFSRWLKDHIDKETSNDKETRNAGI